MLNQILQVFLAVVDWFVRTFIFLVDWLYGLLMGIFRG